jgi:hypothetical protein
MSLLEKQPIKRPQLPAHLQATLNGIFQKQKISPDEPVLDLEIDDEMISGAVVDEDKMDSEPLPLEYPEGNEPLIGWDNFAHAEDALILEPVAREQIEPSPARRERFEPPTITVIEPPPHELLEHSPAPAKVIASQQENPALIVQSAPAGMRTKLFLVLLIIIGAALALTLFDPVASFRSQGPTNSPPEAATKEGSTEAAQPAKPALNSVEDRAPLDSNVDSSKVGSTGGTSSRVRRRAPLLYSRQKPIARKFKSNTAVRSAKRARTRARYN